MLGFFLLPLLHVINCLFFSNNISLYIHLSSVQSCSLFFLWHPLYSSRTVLSKSDLLLVLFWVQIFYIYYLRSHREHLLAQSEFFTWILPVIVFRIPLVSLTELASSPARLQTLTAKMQKRGGACWSSFCDPAQCRWAVSLIRSLSFASAF